MADPAEALPPRRLFRTRGASLTSRILAVNIVALGLLAGSVFYIDSYRNRLIAERFQLARAEAQIAASGIAAARRFERRKLIGRVGTEQGLRLRLYDRRGRLTADSFKLAEPTFQLVDPASEAWYLHAARAIDRGMDFLVGTPPLPDYSEPAEENAEAFPEVAEARDTGLAQMRQRLAPDRTPVITAAVPVGTRGEVLLTTRNARDITQAVRDARQTLAIIIGAALFVSILLSLFLARTIVRPLRALVRAAVRVRLGRDRAVVVPRLPERGDEIGLLARAFSDMTEALRQRIDGVESFAADVAHELKNPLASLRSAIESLDRVEDPELRRQLSTIAAHDVRRIDRLVTEIADASRIDAELSRAVFEPVDLSALVETMAEARRHSGVDGNRTIAIHREGARFIVPGVARRLERVLANLLDNAVSFSPPDGRIVVTLSRWDGRVEISVSDEGPGIAPEAREKVFGRFHSLRPEDEDFGSHSGLGLAIARTIAEAHDGRLTAQDRADGRQGACLVVNLPEWQQP
ncbi:MAG: hypothetical protein RIQ46_577 [Pseudomonadota bacterium]|jgi:two-component system sensor histidine kinase ChvG